MSTQDQQTDQAGAAVATADAPQAPDASTGVACRHCGQAKADDAVTASDNSDWLCGACDRYQDATVCPTCGGNARISALPENMRPAGHAPARRQKAKE